MFHVEQRLFQYCMPSLVEGSRVSYISNMKKIPFIILSLTVYSLALDCINLATYGMIYTLPNTRPDSTITNSTKKIVTVVGEERIETTTPYYLTRKIIWDGNTVKYTLQYSGSNIDSLENTSTIRKTITVEQDGDEISAKSNDEDYKSEEINYIGKDSSYASSTTNGYKNGSYYRSSTTEIRSIRNDTLFIRKSSSESSDNSFSGGSNNYIIIRDPDNKNQCIEKTYRINDDGTMSVNDKIISVHTIEKTANGFVTTQKYVSDSSSYKVFYVYNQNTTSLKKNIHSIFVPKNIQLFDLLGRPANSKHIIKVNR